MYSKNYTYNYFLGMLDDIKMKFGQILVQLMKNIFKSFLAQLCRLGTTILVIIFWNFTIF